MKAPGDAAMELSWLPPSAAALAALTRPRCASLWAQLRHDPGCVLLAARSQGDGALPLSATLHSLPILETALQFLHNAAVPFVAWRDPGAARIVRIAQQQAWLAAELATRAGCDPERAWTGGLLAPLGWLALAAVQPALVAESLHKLETHEETATWQRDLWGMDHTALARRLGRLWRLPAWLGPILSHLGLHVRIAERFGAEPALFQVVQLAVALTQEHERGFGLVLGAAADELAAGLDLATLELDVLAERAAQAPQVLVTDTDCAPAALADLLRLAVEQRRQDETMTRLQRDLDQLQQALEQQCREEKDRVHAQKLSAVAELAAGAGHEINNPLAVISGQAQYLLKQLMLAEEQLVEDPSPTLYLDSLKDKLHKALTTIVGQAHRIHHVLTDLMQFARPSIPRKQPIALAALLRDAVGSHQAALDEKKVMLHQSEVPGELLIRGDAAQWRTVVGNVLRNAVEAAPAEGWVRLGCTARSPDWLEITIEDNGPGPAPGQREHLFDPFFSGRSAGRGRGLGLSTAWRLARQNGGDVRFGGVNPEATRFILRLPVGHDAVGHVNGNGHVPDAAKRAGSQPITL